MEATKPTPSRMIMGMSLSRQALGAVRARVERRRRLGPGYIPRIPQLRIGHFAGRLRVSLKIGHPNRGKPAEGNG